MSLLQHSPRFDRTGAARLARELYGLDAAVSPLPSERDQNFLLTIAADERYVLKIANASEDRAMLEAQNAAMAHVSRRVSFCPRVIATAEGNTIGMTASGHFVRLVTYLPGVPLAEMGGPDRAAGPEMAGLHQALGRGIGELDAAFADFDHPAVHRDFHWDLANAARVLREHLPRIGDRADRDLVARVSEDALAIVETGQRQFRRSVIHNDANDWNVLVDGDRIAGVIDFGDMVHSWTVADPAIAIAYAVLDKPNPLDVATAFLRGYHAAYPLRDEEVEALLPLVNLRLCMSACIAAWQRQQRPDDEYLAVSQAPIRRTLPRLAAIPAAAAAQALRSRAH
jgi:Ser/Thr protein kinase RdoA (MazF antagonist)